MGSLHKRGSSLSTFEEELSGFLWSARVRGVESHKRRADGGVVLTSYSSLAMIAVVSEGYRRACRRRGWRFAFGDVRKPAMRCPGEMERCGSQVRVRDFSANATKRRAVGVGGTDADKARAISQEQHLRIRCRVPDESH